MNNAQPDHSDIQEQKTIKDSTDILQYFFSFNGVATRLDYLGIVCILNLVLDAIMRFNNIFLDAFVYAVFVYIFLAFVQKRCRDFNTKGTFFLVVFSLLFPIIFYLKFSRINSINFPSDWNIGIAIVIMIFLVCHFILLLVPGKKEKNMSLMCPLLKHPYIYVGVCYILYLIGFYYLIQFQ